MKFLKYCGIALGIQISIVSCVSTDSKERRVERAPFLNPSQKSSREALYPPQKIEPKVLQESMVTILHKGLVGAEKILNSPPKDLSLELCHDSGYATGALFFGLQLENLDWLNLVERVNRKLKETGSRQYLNYGEMITVQTQAWQRCREHSEILKN